MKTSNQDKKTSSVLAGIPGVDWETKYITITEPEIIVIHENTREGDVYKTCLLQEGKIVYNLDAGTRSVRPGGYDHAAVFSGTLRGATSVIKYV